MAVTPKEMLAAAEALHAGSAEVDWRNGASRAYYAAYHRCRQLATEEKLRVAEGGSGHVPLVDALWDSANSRPVRELGHMLDRCRMRRRKADYEIDVVFPRQFGETVVGDCAQILIAADSV